MNDAQRRLAYAMEAAGFEVDEAAAVLAAIELAVVVGSKAETFPYGHPANPSNQRARAVAAILLKYTEEP